MTLKLNFRNILILSQVKRTCKTWNYLLSTLQYYLILITFLFAMRRGIPFFAHFIFDALILWHFYMTVVIPIMWGEWIKNIWRKNISGWQSKMRKTIAKEKALGICKINILHIITFTFFSFNFPHHEHASQYLECCSVIICWIVGWFLHCRYCARF